MQPITAFPSTASVCSLLEAGTVGRFNFRRRRMAILPTSTKVLLSHSEPHGMHSETFQCCSTILPSERLVSGLTCCPQFQRGRIISGIRTVEVESRSSGGERNIGVSFLSLRRTVPHGQSKLSLAPQLVPFTGAIASFRVGSCADCKRFP